MSPLKPLISIILLSPAFTLAAPPAYQGLVLGPPNSYAAAIGGGQVGGEIAGIPTLWTSLSPDSATPLTTDGSHGFVNAVDGTHQAGYVEDAAGFPQATLWSGSAASALNLNPPGYSQSSINALLGDYQAGFGISTADSQMHALLWHGSANSAIDLNPPGYLNSGINGMSANYLVGHGTPDTPGAASHALLWNRSTGQLLDLGTGTATAIAGGQITGIWHDFAGDSHPRLWNDLGLSSVDLDHGPINLPMGVIDTNGTTQIGYFVGTYDHATAWSGTRDSIVNLDEFLPGFNPYYDEFVQSSANAIDAQGLIAGSYADRAILWIPSTLLPDPALATPTALLVPLLHRPQRRRPRALLDNLR